MKSELVTNNSDDKYPCIKKWVKGGIIILFNMKGCGTVIYVPPNCTEDEKLGDYSNDWNMDCFEDFYGVIKLEG